MKVAPNFIDSIMITVPAAIISAFIGSINGYVFAKSEVPGFEHDLRPVSRRHVPAVPGRA